MHVLEHQKPIHILLVEDSDADAFQIAYALRNARISNCLYRVAAGEEALEFLRRQGHFADAPRPSLILLDLNLPKMHGREVLAEIKADGDLKMIPVVVLSASRSEEDIIQVYSCYANCYINKPSSCEGFSVIVESIEEFWFSVVTLPTYACWEEDGEGG